MTQTNPTEVVVELVVHHGDYYAEFFGFGVTPLEAAAEAARQTSYAAELFNKSDSHYETRSKFRDSMSDTLAAGQVYRGYGWCSFKVLGVA